MINFCCVIYGNKYKVVYVQHLYNMIKRHLTVPYKFICFTDHVKIHKQIEGDIEFRKFNKHNLQGWWNKLQLFNPETGLDGTNFYLDLDVVITENIDCFATYGDEDTFGIIRDFGQPKMFYNSSVMKWNNKTSEKIWKEFYDNQSKYKKMQGDQNVVTEIMKDDKNLKVFPDEWTQSYKWLDRSQTRFHKQKWTFEQSKTAKIAVFHGHPNPHESDQEWVKTNWK